MTTFTKRMAAMLMMLCLLVGLVIPAAAAPSATVVVTTATGYTAASDVVYNITDGIIANWGARGETSTFLTTYAESFYTSGYTYEELAVLNGGTSSTAPSSALYSTLQELMVKNHSFFTKYSGSGKADSRQLYKYTDCVSGDTSKVSLLYLGTLVNSTWDSGATYNQEHVWPNSKCIGSDSTDIGDIMHLRAANPTENSTRGNKAYGESSGYYDPGVSVRGDCARTLLYMYTRWGNTGNMWGTEGVMESLDILLKWIEEDPVDTWEMGHNDSVQSITGTRNVFVDYPELAFMLFNETVPADMVTPSGGSGDHEHSYTATVTAPTCEERGYTTYICTCGVRYVGAYTDALGHRFAGGTCTACGASEVTGYVATLATSLSDLQVGDQIVIVAGGYDCALSTTQNGNNRGQTDITISDDGSTVSFATDSAIQIITLENGTTSGTFAFNVGNGYLYAASSSKNYLRTETKLSANSSWAISIANGIATIKAKGSNTRNWMRYNNANDLFACYSSGQQDISIYIIEPPACQHSYEGVVTAPTCNVDGIRTYTCTLCGDSYTETIAATGHNYESVVTAPTCTADGYTTYTCTACGDKYVGNKVTTSGHSYESVVTAPTCKADGYTTHTCTACGDKYVDSMVPTSGHSYESVVTPPTYNADGYTTHTCTACGHSYVNSIVPATGFTLAGANTVLGGVLDMNFFIKPSDLNGTDYYAVITLYAEDGVVTTTVPYDKWEVRSNYLVVTQKGLAARQMADKMEVVIYNGDGSQASFMWTDSIRGYVMRILEKQNAETKTMLVDMLNYGAAAQNFFEYNMDDLANNQFSDTQKAYATESVNCVNQQVKGENYFGSTLTLRDRIMLTMNFSNINPDMYAIVSFTDHKGVAHETRVEGSSFSKYNSTTYGVVVDELVVADGDQLVTVTVYDAAGNVVASASDSVNSYAARQMGKDALYEMVAKFTTSAYAHFH